MVDELQWLIFVNGQCLLTVMMIHDFMIVSGHSYWQCRTIILHHYMLVDPVVAYRTKHGALEKMVFFK